ELSFEILQRRPFGAEQGNQPGDRASLMRVEYIQRPGEEIQGFLLRFAEAEAGGYLLEITLHAAESASNRFGLPAATLAGRPFLAALLAATADAGSPAEIPESSPAELSTSGAFETL